MTAKRLSIELSALTELLAAGDVAGAQGLLDRRGVGGGRSAGGNDAGQPGDTAAGDEAAATLRDRLLAARNRADGGTRRDGSPAAQKEREATQGGDDAAGQDEVGLAGSPASLTDACGGREVTIAGPLGEWAYWLVDGAVADVLPDESAVEAECAAVLRGARQRFDELEASAELCVLADGGPGDPFFMDIETCGLSGAMIFLVGLMRYNGGRLVFQQHLARDYAEERAILSAFAEALPTAGVLVTFNGKSFDVPMIRERSIIHRVDLPVAVGRGSRRRGARRHSACPRERGHGTQVTNIEPPHLDLLHEARRRWKGQLPNCRLQTLENHLCRRSRTDDIPGGDIPEAYHRFVRTGDARRLADILRHNLLDMLTMVQLVSILLTSCEADGQ